MHYRRSKTISYRRGRCQATGRNIAITPNRPATVTQPTATAATVGGGHVGKGGQGAIWEGWGKGEAGAKPCRFLKKKKHKNTTTIGIGLELDVLLIGPLWVTGRGRRLRRLASVAGQMRVRCGGCAAGCRLFRAEPRRLSSLLPGTKTQGWGQKKAGGISPPGPVGSRLVFVLGEFQLEVRRLHFCVEGCLRGIQDSLGGSLIELGGYVFRSLDFLCDRVGFLGGFARLTKTGHDH